MNRAVSLLICRADPEERAGFWQEFEDTPVRKETGLVTVDDHFPELARVLVQQQESMTAVIFFDAMDKPEMAAALSALDTLESQKNTS